MNNFFEKPSITEIRYKPQISSGCAFRHNIQPNAFLSRGGVWPLRCIIFLPAVNINLS